jgi:hypothetical protein
MWKDLSEAQLIKILEPKETLEVRRYAAWPHPCCCLPYLCWSAIIKNDNKHFILWFDNRNVQDALNIVDDGDDIGEILIDLYYNAIAYPSHNNNNFEDTELFRHMNFHGHRGGHHQSCQYTKILVMMNTTLNTRE